jgi:hypothetical protein
MAVHTPHDLKAATDALRAAGGNKSKAADALGVPRSTFRERIAAAQREGAGADPSARETFHVTGDAATLTRLVNTRIRTLAELIETCEIDTTEWMVERYVVNKWEVGAKDAAGKIAVEPLFQVKAWLTRKRAVISARAEIEALLADAGKKAPARPRLLRLKKPDPVLLELAIPDLHVGKLAWAPETGYGDYDIRIAEQLFTDAVESLLARTSSFHPDRIVLPLGNDLLHRDTKQGTTTQGTPLDTDSRYHKTFSTTRRMLTRTIDRLREVAPVTVVMVPGNHDTLSTFHMGDSLECYYRNTPDVSVQNSPACRKYVGYGAVALMFTHGHLGKPADWPLLFATEQPEMFAKATFREIHTGHLHTTRLTEKMGVRVRISPALCGPDAWHADNQFVGNLRGAEAYVWHPRAGLLSVAHFTVSEGREHAKPARIELAHG